MSEVRKYSILDKITPLQSQAWVEENQALVAKKQGAEDAAVYHTGIAESLRSADIEQKIQTLFDYSDAQNAVIEVGLKLHAEGREIPIAISQIMEPAVNYALMRQ